MIFIILACLVIMVVYIVIRILHRSVVIKKMGLPFVRGGLPIFGQAFTMMRGSPWDTMANWALEYGTIYRFHLFGSDAVVVADPALLKIILSTKLSVFKKDLGWTYKPFLVLLGNGLVTADGKSWRDQRTLLSAYLRIEILEDIPDMALRAVQRLGAKLDEAKLTGRVLEMAEEFRHLTLHVITEAILSLSPEESDQTFAKMYLPIVEEGNLRTWGPHRMYIPSPAWFAFRRAVKRLNDYVTGLILKRWELRLRESAGLSPAARKQDTLDKILSAIPADDWSPEVVTQIRDEVKTFILAGHETSASMLSWALYELVCNPNHLARVKAEAASVYRKSEHSGIWNVDDTNKGATVAQRLNMRRSDLDKTLLFTECSLRESLRKYSNVPTVVRVAAQDIELAGKCFIPRGTTVMLNMQGVHHNPEIWPEPLVYNPARFLEEIKPYTFIPFTEGPRMCIGQYLSLLESKIVLSYLVGKYTFELQNPGDAGAKHPFMVPIIPKTGHFMRVV